MTNLISAYNDKSFDYSNHMDYFTQGKDRANQVIPDIPYCFVPGSTVYVISSSLSSDAELEIQTDKNFSSKGSAYYFVLTQEIEELLNWVKFNKIFIPKPSEVRNYMLKYDDMVDLTYFVCKTTREKFDYDTQLSLEVFHDPEIEDETLTLYVRQEDYEEDITKKIEELDEEYGEMLMDKTGYLLVMTDFQKPG